MRRHSIRWNLMPTPLVPRSNRTPHVSPSIVNGLAKNPKSQHAAITDSRGEAA